MMRKQHLRNGTCKATFEMPAAAGSELAHLCNDYGGNGSVVNP